MVLMAFLTLSAVPARAQDHWFDPAGVAGDLFGQAVTALGDVNGDGFGELLIGVASSDSAGLDAGQVFLWFGGAEVTLAPDLIWNGTSPERFGWSVANIGDVNGDLKEDWAVGAPMSNSGGGSRGRVCVFYGSATPSSTPDVIIAGESGGDQFGYSVSAAGDFNGDGWDDFIVGAPYNDRRGLDAGAVYVIYGSNGTGPSANLANATVMAGEIANDHFGWSVTEAGNFLGGTAACVAVGAPLANTHGGVDGGAVYVYAGRLGGATPDTTIDFVAGAVANSQLGYAVVRGGRLNADTFDDLAVGAPYSDVAGTDAGRVVVYYGGLNPSVLAGHTIDGQTALDRFGWSLDGVGNVVGTAQDDLVIGAPFRNSVAANAGAAYIYEGGGSASSAASLVVVPNQLLQPSTAAGDNFGHAVAAAGDFDGDGLPDYVVSAPNGNIGSTSAVAGFVTLIHSSPGPVATLLRHWNADWQGTGRVDLAMTLTLPTGQLLDLQLLRELTTGGSVNEAVLWSGPPLAGDGGGVGVLYDTGGGLVFRDELPVALAPGHRLSYGIIAVTTDGTVWRLDHLSGPVAPPAAQSGLLALSPVWPNPANPAVSIRFRAGAGVATSLRVYDVNGHLVRTLPVEPGTGNWQQQTWRGQIDDGRDAPSGVYFIRLQAGSQSRTRRLVLAR